MRINIRRGIRNIFREFLYFEKKDFNKCGENVLIHDSVFIADSRNLTLGSNIYIGPGSRFFTGGELEICGGVVIGEDALIITSNHNYDGEDLKSAPFDNRNIFKKVTIEENTWIGSRVIILPGVTIKRGCVIAAGSVVTKSFEENQIIGGNPAKVIGERTNQELNNLKTWLEKYKKDDKYIIK